MMNQTPVKTIHTLETGETLCEILDSGVVFPLLVTGSSMLPFLRHNRDTVWLVKSAALRRGQILFFRRADGSFVLHRIRRIFRDGRLLVNGDAQSWCEIVLPEQAVAVVCAVTVNGKKQNTDTFLMKFRDLLWYPTRPFRPLLFRMYGVLRRLFP